MLDLHKIFAAKFFNTSKSRWKKMFRERLFSARVISAWHDENLLPICGLYVYSGAKWVLHSNSFAAADTAAVFDSAPHCELSSPISHLLHDSHVLFFLHCEARSFHILAHLFVASIWYLSHISFHFSSPSRITLSNTLQDFPLHNTIVFPRCQSCPWSDMNNASTKVLFAGM